LLAATLTANSIAGLFITIYGVYFVIKKS